MREVAFIKQNKEKWLDFEQSLDRKNSKSPDELASLYIHLMNDLAYAQTYYPKSKVVQYLNGLASKAYQKIYTTKRGNKNILLYFFLEDVPSLMYKYRRYVQISFIFFFVFAAIGAISCAYDSEFARSFFGDHYVDTTLENIKNGRPMAVYEGGSAWSSFIGITENNITVGAKEFLSGIFLGLGTAYIYMYNAVMVGTFQFFFFKHNSFWESVQGIWIHGTFEIFAMIIEAAAGFIIGGSILFPKTLSRFNSFKIGIRDAFKIFASTLPFTIIAGFLEGYVTRFANDMPAILKIVIILICATTIVYYYLIYPFKLTKKLQHQHAITKI
ncbi:MAG: stage II sporulation protein M [Flavobacteriaceae bacterium]|nr:stage II sporulation protein M [Flavobacteriaceae bacterium]